jgi:hypothetical protein
MFMNAAELMSQRVSGTLFRRPLHSQAADTIVFITEASFMF